MLRFWEGFDGIPANSQASFSPMLMLGTAGSTISTGNSSPTPPYGTGTYAIFGWGPVWFYKVLDNQNTWYFSFHVCAKNAVGTSNSVVFFYLADGTTYQVAISIDISKFSGMNLRAWRGNKTAQLGSDFGTFGLNTWQWVTGKVVIHPSAGELLIYVNGTEWINLTGINTAPSGNAYANRMYIGCGGTSLNGNNLALDNLVLCDGQDGTATQGQPWNTLLGEKRIIWTPPDADGSISEWTQSTGANRFGTLDEAPHNSDTDYCSADGGLRQRVGLSTPSVAGIIEAARVEAWARKDNAGTRNIRLGIVLDSTLYEEGSDQSLGSTYTRFDRELILNPATDDLFTAAEIAAAELQIRTT